MILDVNASFDSRWEISDSSHFGLKCFLAYSKARPIILETVVLQSLPPNCSRSGTNRFDHLRYEDQVTIMASPLILP